MLFAFVYFSLYWKKLIFPSPLCVLYVHTTTTLTTLLTHLVTEGMVPPHPRPQQFPNTSGVSYSLTLF